MESTNAEQLTAFFWRSARTALYSAAAYLVATGGADFGRGLLVAVAAGIIGGADKVRRMRKVK